MKKQNGLPWCRAGQVEGWERRMGLFREGYDGLREGQSELKDRPMMNMKAGSETASDLLEEKIDTGIQ